MIKSCENCKNKYEMHEGSNVCPECGERTFVSSQEKKPTVLRELLKSKPITRKEVTKTQPTIWKEDSPPPPTKWTQK